jgi:hypothetical protein
MNSYLQGKWFLLPPVKRVGGAGREASCQHGARQQRQQTAGTSPQLARRLGSGAGEPLAGVGGQLGREALVPAQGGGAPA